MDTINQEVFPYRSAMLKKGSDVDYIECKGAVFVRLRNVRQSISEGLQYPARIESFVVLYCARGTLSFTSHLQSFEMVENTLFPIANTMLQFKDCSSDCELYALAFSQNFAAQMNVDVCHLLPIMSDFNSNSKVYKVPNDSREVIERSFNRILECKLEMEHLQTPYADMSIAHFFAAMFYANLCTMTAEVEPVYDDTKNRSKEYFVRLLQLLGEHYKTERSVEFYAEKMRLTPKHLSRSIRNYSGRSVHQWIDAFVVQEIKNLLKHSTLSVQQISYELQFSNPSFMGQYFKRVTGKTPGEYRREK